MPNVSINYYFFALPSARHVNSGIFLRTARFFMYFERTSPEKRRIWNQWNLFAADIFRDVAAKLILHRFYSLSSNTRGGQLFLLLAHIMRVAYTFYLNYMMSIRHCRLNAMPRYPITVSKALALFYINEFSQIFLDRHSDWHSARIALFSISFGGAYIYFISFLV